VQLLTSIDKPTRACAFQLWKRTMFKTFVVQTYKDAEKGRRVCRPFPEMERDWEMKRA